MEFPVVHTSRLATSSQTGSLPLGLISPHLCCPSSSLSSSLSILPSFPPIRLKAVHYSRRPIKRIIRFFPIRWSFSPAFNRLVWFCLGRTPLSPGNSIPFPDALQNINTPDSENLYTPSLKTKGQLWSSRCSTVESSLTVEMFYCRNSSTDGAPKH